MTKIKWQKLGILLKMELYIYKLLILNDFTPLT